MAARRQLVAGLIATLALTAACAPGGDRAGAPESSHASVPVVPLDSLFALVAAVPLRTDSGRPISFPSSMARIGRQLYVADAGLSEIKVFDAESGALIRVLGRAGDGPGEFRTPATLAVINGSQLLAFDINRNVLSVWDSTGAVVRERQLLALFTSLSPTADGRRVIAGGWHTRSGGKDFDEQGRRPIVHEIDVDSGTAVQSYTLHKPETNHPWSSVFATPAAALIGDIVASGTMSSNVIHFHDRATGREWTAAIGAPWYHPPDWPERPVEGKGMIDAMNRWQREQKMLVGLLGIDQRRFLATFLSIDSTGGRHFSYIVADTAGRSEASSLDNDTQIMAMSNGELLGIDPDAEDGGAVLWRFKVRR